MKDRKLCGGFYGAGGYPARHFLKDLTKKRPGISVGIFRDTAKQLERNDIVEALKKFQDKTLIVNLDDVSTVELADLLSLTGLTTSCWKDFASEFDFNMTEISVLDKTKKYSPTQVLLLILVKQNPRLHIDVVVKALEEMHRMDAVQFLNSKIPSIKKQDMNQGKNKIDVIQESVECNVCFIENLRIDNEMMKSIVI